MREDDPQSERSCVAANENDVDPHTAKVNTALTRIAEAIGRHIAREHIRARTAANDNEPSPKKPTAPDS